MLSKVYSNLKNFALEQAKLKSDLVWNLCSFAVMAICGLAINVIIAVLFSKSALGLFNISFSFHIILSQIAVAGLQSSALKHIAEFNHSDNDISNCLKSALMFGLSFSAIITAVFAFNMNFIAEIMQSPELGISFTYLLPGLFFFSLNKIMLFSVNGLRHMRAYAIFNASRYFSICLCIILLASITTFRESPACLSLALSIPEVFLFPCLVYYLRRYIFCHFDFRGISHWKTIHLKYIYKGGINGILIEVNSRIDVLILGVFADNATVGYYSFASTFAEGIKQITVIVKSVIDPVFSKSFSLRDTEAVKNIIIKFRESIYPIIVLTCLASIILYPIGLKLAGIHSEYQASIKIFTVITLGIALSSYFNIFGGIILQSGRPGWQSILVLITALLNITLCFILIPLFGSLGAAIALASTFLAEAFIVRHWIRLLT